MTPDLTLTELARVLRRHPETLRRLARMGHLPGTYKLGNAWRIAPENVARLRHLPPGATSDAGREGGDA